MRHFTNDTFVSFWSVTNISSFFTESFSITLLLHSFLKSKHNRSCSCVAEWSKRGGSMFSCAAARGRFRRLMKWYVTTAMQTLREVLMFVERP